jgi:ABC-type glutathione transport system ATPase component
MALLEVIDLKKVFEGQRRPALDGVSFALDRKEVLAIVGESGSGKSTLARAVVRLIEPTTGRVLFDGRDITHERQRDLISFRKRAQILFQDPASALDPRMTVREALLEPLSIHRLDASSARVEALLSRVSLDPGLAPRFPHELSGGQKQRVALARALAVEPELLVLDEPLALLDVLAAAEMLELLEQLRESSATSYLFISHDPRAVSRIASRIAVLSAGRVASLSEAPPPRPSDTR